MHIFWGLFLVCSRVSYGKVSLVTLAYPGGTLGVSCWIPQLLLALETRPWSETLIILDTIFWGINMKFPHLVSKKFSPTSSFLPNHAAKKSKKNVHLHPIKAKNRHHSLWSSWSKSKKKKDLNVVAANKRRSNNDDKELEHKSMIINKIMDRRRNERRKLRFCCVKLNCLCTKQQSIVID